VSNRFDQAIFESLSHLRGCHGTETLQDHRAGESGEHGVAAVPEGPSHEVDGVEDLLRVDRAGQHVVAHVLHAGEVGQGAAVAGEGGVEVAELRAGQGRLHLAQVLFGRGHRVRTGLHRLVVLGGGRVVRGLQAPAVAADAAVAPEAADPVDGLGVRPGVGVDRVLFLGEVGLTGAHLLRVRPHRLRGRAVRVDQRAEEVRQRFQGLLERVGARAKPGAEVRVAEHADDAGPHTVALRLAVGQPGGHGIVLRRVAGPGAVGGQRVRGAAARCVLRHSANTRPW
jgi:hypothetical protein